MTVRNGKSFELPEAISTYADAVDDLAFLGRSKHRVHVLQLLSERPRSREELATATEVTRVTLSRILSDLEDRGWVDRWYDEGQFSITGLGASVYEDTARLLGTVQVGRENRELVDRLSTDWFGFDVRELVDAETVVAESADPTAATRTVADAVADASQVRALVGTVTTLPMQNTIEAARRGDSVDGQVVYDRAATDVCLRKPEVADRWRELESLTDGTVFYSHDASFPCNVDLVDDERVYLTVGDSPGGLRVIASDSPTVVEWARAAFADCRTDATPLVDAGDGYDPDERTTAESK